MRITCDRCLKIASADSGEIANGWLIINTGSGLKYLFCEKCANVFLDTIFDYDEKMDEKDGEQDDT